MARSTDWLTYSPSSLISVELESHYAQQIVTYYHQALFSNPEALNYVSRTFGLSEGSVLSDYQVGFVDRTFPKTLPPTGSVRGEMPRGFYERLQLIDGETGHERFRGMIFIPTFDENGKLIGAYGHRKAAFPVAKRGDARWAIAQGVKGHFFNHSVLSSYNHVLLCETPFDVLSLALGGIYNAIALLDFNYFDDEHLCQLLEYEIGEVTLAFSRTPRGDRYSGHVRKKLTDIGIKVNKLAITVGESVSSVWAQSQRFAQLKKELSRLQSCQKPYH